MLVGFGLGIIQDTWGQGVFYPSLLLLLVGEPAARCSLVSPLFRHTRRVWGGHGSNAMIPQAAELFTCSLL